MLRHKVSEEGDSCFVRLTTRVRVLRGTGGREATDIGETRRVREGLSDSPEGQPFGLVSRSIIAGVTVGERQRPITLIQV